jgi:ABC-type cobalamin transport system ATPase subunit
VRRIHYAEGSVLTGDDIAAAVLEYARMLASTATAATVEIPVRRGGDVLAARLLLGPSSQMLVEDEPEDAVEVVDEALVADLLDRARRLSRPVPMATDDDLAMPLDVLDY